MREDPQTLRDTNIKTAQRRSGFLIIGWQKIAGYDNSYMTPSLPAWQQGQVWLIMKKPVRPASRRDRSSPSVKQASLFSMDHLSVRQTIGTRTSNGNSKYWYWAATTAQDVAQRAQKQGNKQIIRRIYYSHAANVLTSSGEDITLAGTRTIATPQIASTKARRESSAAEPQ